jgi:coproporphyrinogen III oxidase
VMLLLPVFAAAGFTVGSSAAAFAGGIRELQDLMIAKAKAADPTAAWHIDEHSRGRACIIEDGDVWEKGCISVTLIEDGELTATRAEAISARTGSSTITEGSHYSACALSFVLHARSPLVPTLRGDVRVFAVEGCDEWYGGGIDLTPSYVEDDDCTYFHTELSKLCAAHGDADTYSEMKKTCDDYFFIPCRREHRGVGGVFFDDLAEPWAADLCIALMRSALDDEGPYMPIARKRMQLERSSGHTEAQKEWQLLRRGRYVEFNLLYDRGVKFGLSPESVERVLVSSPPMVAFKYKASSEPPHGTPEAETLEVLRHPREWASV